MPDVKQTPEETNETENVAELFLVRLRYKEGRLVETGGNQPFLLNDPAMAWVVFTGKIDVFAVRLQNGEPVGTRTYLFSVQPGRALFGLDLSRADRGVGLLAVGVGLTEVVRLPLTRLQELAQEPELTELVADLLQHWVAGLSASMVSGMPAKVYEPLTPGQELDLAAQVIAFPPKGLVWVKLLTGRGFFISLPDLPALSPDGFWPIASQSWLETGEPSRLAIVDTPTFISRDTAWTGLVNFHDLVLACVAYNLARIETAERERQARSAEADRVQMSKTLAEFVSVLTPAAKELVVEAADNPLLLACRMVGQAQGITIRPHPDMLRGKTVKDPLNSIARTSKIRTRQVALRDDWWRRDNGPLLAYRIEERQPVALLPTSSRSYDLYNPVTQSRQPVTAAVAETVYPFAHIFYRPLPDRVLTSLDLLKFGLPAVRQELTLIGLIGLLIGLLGLVNPKLTELLFDNVIPGADRNQLLQLTLGLLAVAVGKTLFELTRGFALLRVESKLDGVIQAAVWDRLLRLPTAFFRQYTAGDLADRTNGISAIRQVLTGATLNTFLSGMFSLLNFFLLFWYSWQLALVAVGLTIIAIGVLAVASYFQLGYQRKLMQRQGKISGMVLQFITAISKFRVSGSESRAFSVWAGQFIKQRDLSYQTERVSNYIVTFNSSYQLVTSMAIFTMLMYLMSIADEQTAAMSIGSFLGFNAAFGQFLSAALQLTSTAITVLSIVPIYERTKPIFEAVPEVDATKVDPGELAGDIEISHISFRYTPDGPLILNDLSLHIKPREFVALVGPSGTGKSTLFRLLLGFETPENGSIYYNGQDLKTLDVHEVRHQIGTVLQQGQLMPGDVFTNIVGTSPLTIDDAWEAARMAGLEEDIKQLPMGMHTVVGEGGGTFSGGQRQRLVIARAIVNKPRILFFDEATSALDNRTQTIVSQSLERLQATRVVIAHRLSTIINADRICVLMNGQIVQQGAYQELIDQPGPFAELAKRQLA
ncbi:MAG: NHLP bacteriocin export ABC transporter permease/ATPase subunit [Anaerolineae bacterium]|nr:NHLP bacteriocin export ABC transporter permease/ATPase subunit [Anaerolineae bacterium]